MGGYSVGELYASVRLDNGQYVEALQQCEAATALLSVNVGKIGDSVGLLDRELRNAGFVTKEFQGYLNSLRSQGLSTGEAVRELGNNISVLQAKIVALRSQNTASIPKSVSDGALAEAEAVYAEQRRILALVQRGAVEDKLDKDAALRQREMIARDQAAIIEQEQLEAASAAQRTAIEGGATARRIDLFAAETKAAEAAFAEQVRAAEAQAATRVEIEAGAARRRTDIIAAELARAEALFAEEAAAGSAASAGGIGGRLGIGIGKGGISPHGSSSSGALIGAGVTIFGGYEVTKQAAEFEDALAKVRAAIGTTSDDLAHRMGDAAKTAAEATGIAAKEIVAEFGTMSKAEMDVVDQFKNLPVLAQFAVATNTELDKSAKLVLTVMNTLKIPFSELPQVTNQFTAANHLAIGSVDDFAKALEGRAGAAFRAAKVPLNEALGMTIAFARGGVEASIAQTALTQTVLKLTNSVQKHGDVLLDVEGKQVKWHDVIYNANGELNKMGDVFTTLDKAFAGAPTEKITQFFQAIGVSGQRDVYVKSLLGMGQAITEFSDKLKSPGEERLKAFDAAMQSPVQQFKQLKETVRDTAIALGEQFLPATQLVAQGLKSGVSGVQMYLDVLRGVYQVAKEMAVHSAEDRAKAANEAEAKAAADLYKKLSTTTAKPSGGPLFDDPTADAKAEAKRQLELDRVYRVKQQEITNTENAEKSKLKIALLSEADLDEADEASINRKRDRLIKYNEDVLAVTLDANAKRLEIEKGRTGEKTDLSIVGSSQQAMAQAEEENLQLRNQASAKARALLMADAKEEARIRQQEADEERRLNTQKVNDHIHALQLDLEATREHGTHVLEMAKSRAAFEESMGLISKAEELKQERQIEADEFKIQSDAIDAEIKLLDGRQNRIGQKDEAIETKKQALLNKRQKLEDDHESRLQGYDQRELQGLDALEEATVRLVVEQRKLMEMGDQSDRLVALKNLEIQTEALATKSRGLGGVYVDIADSFQNAMKSVGKTLAGAFIDPANFTKNWKSALKSIETELLGTFLQSMLNLGAAELLSTLKVGTAKKAAAVAQIVAIKATAAAQIAADAEVFAAKSSLMASEKTAVVASSELIALAQIAAEAAVGGAAAAASIAAIPIFGPGLAIEAGQAMQAAIIGTFAPQMLTFSNGGDVVKDTVALVHGGEHVIGPDLTAALKGMVNGSGFGGGLTVDLRGATFGTGLTQAMVDSYMQSAVGKIRRSGGLATKQGRF